ncbi:hypothetical protein HFP15_31105 [Amycolatopsis sp. K13G38]|uniref:Uncharacterized protein n=1 Tax=Amycolatopsis acididurans TaxID=2724524 RepID=A0ABX1JEN5_9PSEU|nr:hypothetical protein [Amycolatopsis acididurans]NKQ57324.1 hypothetical protein [Amycolatopsis acididurans]
MPDTETPHTHTLFALGRGEHAEPLGGFGGYLAPAELVRVPIGRQLLAASTATEVRERFARFALAWDVAGYDTFNRTRREPRIPSSVPGRADWVPYEHRRDIYAFDDGTWFLWIATDYPQWHRLSFKPDGTIHEEPVARIYGTDYARTHGLDLPQLAAWIMGAATERLANSDLALSALVHTGENQDEPAIHFTVHNGHDSDRGLVTAELESIAQTHNWSNPCDPDDRRFTLCTGHPQAVALGEILIVEDEPYDE